MQTQLSVIVFLISAQKGVQISKFTYPATERANSYLVDKNGISRVIRKTELLSPDAVYKNSLPGRIIGFKCWFRGDNQVKAELECLTAALRVTDRIETELTGIKAELKTYQNSKK